jgi:hypothetical protein
MTVCGNFFDGETFVIIENDMNRVTGDKDDNLFMQVNVYEKAQDSDNWVEILVWDCVEWREEGSCAFEAILGVIAKVAAGVPVQLT